MNLLKAYMTSACKYSTPLMTVIKQVRKATVAIDTVNDFHHRPTDLAMGRERLDDVNEGLVNSYMENDRGQSDPRSAFPPDA